jgi:hypothetical protein
MKELMLFISGERGLVRRYLLLSVGLVALTFVAAQSLVALLTLVVPDQTQRISANTPPTGTRLYTVTRSVLDDNNLAFPDTFPLNRTIVRPQPGLKSRP